MAAQYSARRADHIEYAFWLIFGNDGGVRLTRGKPQIDRHQRRVQLTATLPLSLFSTPELRATITVPPTDNAPVDIAIDVAREALELALGCDVDIAVARPADGEAH